MKYENLERASLPFWLAYYRGADGAVAALDVPFDTEEAAWAALRQATPDFRAREVGHVPIEEIRDHYISALRRASWPIKVETGEYEEVEVEEEED